MGLIIKGTIPRGPYHFPYDCLMVVRDFVYFERSLAGLSCTLTVSTCFNQEFLMWSSWYNLFYAIFFALDEGETWGFWRTDFHWLWIKLWINWPVHFCPKRFTASPAEERHVQIVRKGSDTLRRNARVIVVSYDLIAQNDTWMSFGSTEDLWLACRSWMLFMLFHDFLVVWYFSVVTQETFRRTPAGRPYRMVICDEALLNAALTQTNDQPFAA